MKKNLIFLLLSVGSVALFACDDTRTNVDQNKFWGLGNLFSTSPADMAKDLIQLAYPVAQPRETITVQSDTQLCQSEQNFIQNRMNQVQKVLRDSFGIDQPLRLGFCCSGGGNRAMVGTLGFLTGAAKSNILDAALYSAGLSGSTWLLAELHYLAATSHKYQPLEAVLHEIKEDYKKRLSHYSMINVNGAYGPPLLSFESTDDILVEVAKRFAYDQDLTLVNLFGAMVSDYALGLMGCDRLSEKWTTIAAEAEQGSMPLPLCAAIFDTPQDTYEWFETSPLQCGSTQLGYIPIQYLGSGFENGVLHADKVCHEYPISFFLGMYGSAFAVTVKELAEYMIRLHKRVTILRDEAITKMQKRGLFDNSFVMGFLHSKIEELMMQRNPLTHPQFDNYSQGLPGSILQDEKELGLFDAGIAINLPLPTLLERPGRDLDIVFMYDSNNGTTDILQKMKAFCDRKNISFPAVHHITDLEAQTANVIILNDPRGNNYNKDIATYFYFPTNGIDTKTPPYTTFNFKYADYETEYLASKTEQSFMIALDDIKEVMKLVAQERYA